MNHFEPSQVSLLQYNDWFPGQRTAKALQCDSFSFSQSTVGMKKVE